jgi:SAM-dependent methyltransferase
MTSSKVRAIEAAPEPSSHPFTPLRVARYRAAQSSFPLARALELASFEAAVPEQGEGRPVLEIGSGDGMLTRLLLGRGFQVDTVDPAFGAVEGVRRHHSADVSDGLGFLPEEGRFDLIVSLACMHHVVDIGDSLPVTLAEDITRQARPGATLVLQDVGARKALERTLDQEGAAAAGWTVRFFEEVVDRFSEPRHAGIYVELDAVAGQLEQLGWRTTRCFWHACPWSFPDEAGLLGFLQTLFNLKMTTDRLADLIADGIHRSGEGARLLWGLHCLVMQRDG